MKNIDLKNLGKINIGLGKKKEPDAEARRKEYFSQVKGRPCLAFDFGEYATKIADARVSRNRVSVHNLVVAENPESHARLDASNLKDFRTRIGKALALSNVSYSGGVALCTIDSRNYISRQLEIPYADEKDRQGLISFEMGQTFSMAVEDYAFQHKVLRQYESNGIRMCSVWAAALPKSVCETTYRLLEQLKLKPLIMDHNVNCAERLLCSDSKLRALSDNTTVALVDFGMRGTEVTVFKNRMCVHNSTLDVGENRMVSAVKNELGAQVTDIHNSNKLVIPPQTVCDILKRTDSSEGARIFMSEIEEWLSAVNEVVRRYQISSPDNRISGILLYGGSQQLAWLGVYLEKVTGIPVHGVRSLDCVQLPAKVNANLSQFFNAVGLLAGR